jgi:hypothetical protein
LIYTESPHTGVYPLLGQRTVPRRTGEQVIYAMSLRTYVALIRRRNSALEGVSYSRPDLHKYESPAPRPETPEKTITSRDHRQKELFRYRESNPGLVGTSQDE